MKVFGFNSHVQPRQLGRRQRRYRYASTLLALLAFLLFMDRNPAGASTVTVDADAQFSYAGHLLSSGDFLSAVNEYRRFIFLFPEDSRVEAAAFQIGDCYAAGGQWNQALQAFGNFIGSFGESPLAVRAYFRMSDIYLTSGRTDAALIQLQNLLTVNDDTSIRDEAHYRMGWIYLEMAEWERARAYFDKISSENAGRYRLETLNAGLDRVAFRDRKSPARAGILSIVPGGGHLYCRRYQDALMALLLNGGLIYAAYEAFDHELYALAGVISFVEVGFYSGTVYGAVSSAHKYNQDRENAAIEGLRQRFKIKLSARPANQGLELALQIPF